uniref:Uncharacterized protein n=1 Tax=Oryza glumipatula TaxID=40148 RepID=A0A0D9ZIP9_9ORYZ
MATLKPREILRRKAWQEFDHYDEPRPHCTLSVGIVWVKLDSLCRGELNHSNVRYSRFWSCVIRVIPTSEV